MWRGLLHGSTCGDALAGLLSAAQTERRRGRQPVGQNRERLPAGMTDPTTHPDAFVPVIVSWAESLSMADDRVVQAHRASPWEEIQRDHPGSMLSFASGSAIKRITAGVKARRDRPCQVSICWTGLHPPVKSVSNENKNTAFRSGTRAFLFDIGRFISTYRELARIQYQILNGARLSANLV